MSIGLYLIGMILQMSTQDAWAEQQLWIININGNLSKCKQAMFDVGATRIGMQKTFEESSVLFYLVGMSFGCSFSLVEVDCIDWVKTSLKKRLVRAVIGTGIAIGLRELFRYISIEDQQLTEYMVNLLLPSLVIPFLIYGPFLILC